MLKRAIVLVLLAIFATLNQLTIVLCESEHRTKAAAEKVSDFYCYKCDTIQDDDSCLNIKDNSTVEKCTKEQRICQVQTITMSTPTEDKPQNKAPTLWLLKRGCSKICEPVCVTIGERTKLRACNTCCESSYCNTGNVSSSIHQPMIIKYLQQFLLIFVVVVFSSSSSLTTSFFDDERTTYSNRV